jgi:hypothetical protein
MIQGILELAYLAEATRFADLLWASYHALVRSE